MDWRPRLSQDACEPKGAGREPLVSGLCLPVLLMSGKEVARLRLQPTDTVSHAIKQLRQQHGLTGQIRLSWQSSVLQPDATMAGIGICDGDHVSLVQLSLPHFELATVNAEVIDGGREVRVHQDYWSSWDWATALASPGAESLSVRLGPTASAEKNLPDYFIGAMQEEMWTDSFQNVLADSGVAMVMSSHSHWSGSLKLRGSHHSRPFGFRMFHPGDVVTVEVNAAAGSVRFCHSSKTNLHLAGEWSEPVKAFPENEGTIRLGVSVYCDGADLHQENIESWPAWDEHGNIKDCELLSRSFEICGLDN